MHDRVYGHSVEGQVRIVNLRAIHRTVVDTVDGTAQMSPEKPIKKTRKILSNTATGFLETKVFDRAKLTIGQTFIGPAVVDQIDTTTWVPCGWSASVLEGSMLLIKRLDRT